MSEDQLVDLQRRVAAFAVARDWDQFHSPKNLAIALSVEPQGWDFRRVSGRMREVPAAVVAAAGAAKREFCGE